MTRQSTDAFDVLIEILLIAMIVLPPLAMGAVIPWAKGTLFLLALVLLALWLLQAAWRGRLTVVRNWAWLFLLVFFALVLFQLVPLSPSALKTVSPGASETYARTLPNYPASGEARTLSLSPHTTATTLMRLATLAIVFFVVVNAVRTRWQLAGLVIALVAIGSFEALYGFAEQFSGHKHIFWAPRMWHRVAVTGTFHNKNHFAGLLEMTVPISLGLLLALSRRWQESRSRGPGNATTAVRLAGILSSSRVYQQVLLAALSVIMVVAVFFSLSRAGIICTVATLIGFVAFLGVAAGFRRYTLVMFLIVAVILSISASIGMELVVRGVEDAVSGQSTSWTDRTDIASRALVYFRDFPILGSGLGVSGVVFPRYQSARFGDRLADFLHDDWLQLFCETGFAGGLLVVAGLSVFLWGVMRRTLSRRDPFAKWTAMGALLGVGAMLVHSFFDYNLGKITSNALIFSVLLGFSLVAAGTPSRRKGSTCRLQYWTVSARPIPLRIVLAAIAVGIVASRSYLPFAAIRADLAFNRYLASVGASDYYAFLPMKEGSEPDRAQLEEAVRLDPRNPKHLYYCGCDSMDSADDLVRQRALDAARSIVGPEIERMDPTGLERIVYSLFAGLKAQMLEERRPFVSQAHDSLIRAVDACPTDARLHTLLAEVLMELDPTSPDVLREANTALWLSPNRPATLFASGRIFLLRTLDAALAEEKEPLLTKVRECFRRAIYADPLYADRVYPIVQRSMGGRDDLLSVTPRSLRAYEALSRSLWLSGDWEGVLACLDTIEELAELRAAEDAPKSSSPEERADMENDLAVIPEDPLERFDRGAIGYDLRSQSSISFSVCRQRCQTLAMLGRWHERTQLIPQLRLHRRRHLQKGLAEALRVRKHWRSQEKMALYLKILRQDWSSAETLLDAAEVASLPHALDQVPEGNTSLDHLYRLVINNTELSQDVYDRMIETLKTLPIDTPAQELVVDLVRGAGAVLAGHFREGIGTLKALAARDDKTAAVWRQRHLPWYYLALAYEKTRDLAKAAEAYRQVVKILPTHRKALVRLRDLAPADTDSLSEAIAQLTPEVPCNVDFGGKVTLLGYTFNTQPAPENSEDPSENQNTWSMTYYWQFHDRMLHDYHPAVHFCDENWRTIFQNDHYIRKNEKPYPVDFPRCGEVVVQKFDLSEDPTDVRYMRLLIWSPNPPRLGLSHLYHEGGEDVLRASISFKAPE